MSKILSLELMEATIRDAATRKGETMTVNTDEMKALCIEALRHANLLDRIAELAEAAVVPDGTVPSMSFARGGPRYDPGQAWRSFDQIHRLITDVKSGNWPKEEG